VEKESKGLRIMSYIEAVVVKLRHQTAVGYSRNVLAIRFREWLQPAHRVGVTFQGSAAVRAAAVRSACFRRSVLLQERSSPFGHLRFVQKPVNGSGCLLGAERRGAPGLLTALSPGCGCCCDEKDLAT